jgi:hypothetical protein
MNLFRCEVCRDFEFDTFYAAERHILEQHSGFGWKCVTCKKIFGRRTQTHRNCANGAPPRLRLVVCNRLTAETGLDTEAKYQDFMKAMNSKIGKVKRSRSEATPSAKAERVTENRRRSHSGSNSNHAPPKKMKSVLSRVQPAPTASFGEQRQIVVRTPEYIPTPIVKPMELEIHAPDDDNLSAGRSRSPSPALGSSSSSSSTPTSTPKYSPIRVRVTSPLRNVSPKVKTTPKTSTPVTPVSRAAAEMTLQLSRLAQAQEGHVVLNIGGQRFETSTLTLEANPTSVFAAMVRKESTFQPIIEHGRAVYFIDRDPAHFRHILNYLRNGAAIRLDTLPREKRYLREMMMEAIAYRLEQLHSLLTKMCEQLSEE